MPAIQSGRILNRQDDAIFGICGILAVKSGRADVARTWFGKMQNKGEIGQNIERILDNADSAGRARPVEPMRKRLNK